MSNNSERSNDTHNYPYAEWMLREIKDQYAIENEREEKISAKASAFITVIVAIVTLYIPLIPLDKLKLFFSAAVGGSSIDMLLAIVFLVILGMGIICLTVSFGYMIKAYRVKGFNRVDIDDLVKISAKEDCDNKKTALEQGLTAHYHEILRGTVDKNGNMKINTCSADAVSAGIVWLVMGFGLLSIATIALRIIIVVS